MELSNALSPLANPLLREVANVSPAMSLDLVVGFTTDEEDGSQWPVFRTYFVGAVMVSLHSRQLWRVVGFTRDDLVIVAPHGLGHSSAISTVVYRHEGLDYPPCEEVLQHRDSLLVWS